jgi:hypothetical protein
MRRLGVEEEELFSRLPNNPFTTKKVGGKKIVGILRSLENKGAIKRVGMTGRLKRYILWEKNHKCQRKNI